MKKIRYRSLLLFFLCFSIPQFSEAGLIPYDELGNLPTPGKEEVRSPAQMIVAEFKHAIEAYMTQDYREAQFAIANIKYLVVKNGLAAPAILALLEQKIAEGRMAQLEEEITDQYHELNTEAVTILFGEALALAQEHTIPIPDAILRIAAIMEQGVFDLVYYFKIYKEERATLIEI